MVVLLSVKVIAFPFIVMVRVESVSSEGRVTAMDS